MITKQIKVVKRENPLNDIEIVSEIDSTNLSEINLVYVNDFNALIIEPISKNDVVSHINDAISINIKSETFKKFLLDSNFYVEIIYSDRKEIIFYNIKPSCVILDNISLDTTNGADGKITDSGNCELWNNKDNALLKTKLKRIYYNNIPVEINNETNLLDAFNIIKENGGGYVYPNSEFKDIEINYDVYLDFNGLSFTNLNINGTGSLNFIGCDYSTVFKNCSFNGLVFNLKNSSLIFDNCKFINCSFDLSCESNIKFNKCNLYSEIKNTIIVDDENKTENKIDFTGCLIENYIINNLTAINFYRSKLSNNKFEKNIDSKFYNCSIDISIIESVKKNHFENCSFGKNVNISSFNANIVKCFSFVEESEGSSLVANIIGTYKIFNSTFNELKINNIADNSKSFIVNSTILNPVVINKNNFLTSCNYILYSTIKGNYYSKGNEFDNVINTLVISDRVSKKNNIFSENGSTITTINKLFKVSLIKFSGEMSTYSYLNNAIKCLRYDTNIKGVEINTINLNLELKEFISEYKEIIKRDIFNTIRYESKPSAGCSETTPIVGFGGNILLSYEKTRQGFLEFDLVLDSYKIPSIVNEFENNKNRNTSKVIYKWTLDNKEVISTATTKNWETIYNYKIDFKDYNKIVSCECEYKNSDCEENGIDCKCCVTLYTDVVLKLAEIPTVYFEKTKDTAWTNIEATITATIKNKLTDISLDTINPESKINWYTFSDSKAIVFVNSSDLYNVENYLKSDLIFSPVLKTDERQYFCEFVYKPIEFETSKVIKSDNRLNLIVKNNVIVDQDFTTSGNIELKVDDTLHLCGDIIQGDDVIMEWQISNDGINWTTEFGPITKAENFTKIMTNVNYSGTYYRFYAYNKKENGDIASYDYSAPFTKVTVLPTSITGNEISSNIVLFKLNYNDLINEESVIDVKHNYRLFNSLDNKDLHIDNTLLKKYPSLHKRDRSDLWQHYYSSNEYTGEFYSLYKPYNFPSDVDIDKYNNSFGAAIEEFVETAEQQYGGKLYVLNLDTLNYDKERKINIPVVDTNVYQDYFSAIGINDNIEFNNLCKTVFARNNYIAVTDPTANIIEDNKFSEYDTFTNHFIYKNSDNKFEWNIFLTSEYDNIPYIQLMDLNNSTGDATTAISDIKFHTLSNKIVVTFENDFGNVIKPGLFNLNVIGKKNNLELSEHIKVHSEKNPELKNIKFEPDKKHVGNQYYKATWTIEIPKEYYNIPLIQVFKEISNENNTDKINELIICDIEHRTVYNEDGTVKQKFFDIHFENFTNEDVIKKDTFNVVLTGKDIANYESDKIISLEFKNPLISKYEEVYEDGAQEITYKQKYSENSDYDSNYIEPKWKWYNYEAEKYQKLVIEFDKKFDDFAYAQVYVNSDNFATLANCITDIKFDKEHNYLTVYFEHSKLFDSNIFGDKYVDVIPRNTFTINIIGEKYDNKLKNLHTTRKINVGRVLLYRYDGNAKTIKLVKVIKNPNSISNSYFGSAVEFDNHNNLIISAPGAINNNEISYYFKDGLVMPTIGTSDKLNFKTTGKVYIYNLNDIDNSGNAVFEQFKPIQELTTKMLFKNINYNIGDWGKLTNYYTFKTFLRLYDTKTDGALVDVSFDSYEDYIEYYNFNYKYDSSFKAIFKQPYVLVDFYNKNSNNPYYNIETYNTYATFNTNEEFGTAISYNNDTLIISAPKFENKGFIEAYSYDSASNKYIYASSLLNPYNQNESLFGLNVETGKDHVLVTLRQTSLKQAVCVLKYENRLLKFINTTIAPTTTVNSFSFGNSLDSYNNTFVIGSPNESKIYRYTYNPLNINEKYTKLIQLINLNNFGIENNKNTNIVITGDKILSTYPTYGETIHLTGNKTLNNYGEGAVIQFTLIGGEFII